jgi:predicted transcriptional regulator
MDEPESGLTADPDGRPDFGALTPPDELVRGERTRDDFLDAALALDTPRTASDVAELAGHGVDAAREYLEWFERMGIVTRVTDSPATYERNQSYLNWRRVQTLRDDYSTDELVEFLEAETDRAEALAETFGAESPDAVTLSTHATDTGRSVEAVWKDLSAWRTARRRITLLERVLADESGDTAGRPPTV